MATTSVSEINVRVTEQIEYSSGAKSWVFTINNPNENDLKCVKATPNQRIIAFSEVGEEGTPHIQGAIVFKNPKRWKAVRRALGDRAWTRKMVAEWNVAAEYCIKDGEMIRMENNTKQGARTDLIKFKDAIKSKKRPIEMLEDADLMMCMAKFPRFESRVTEIMAKERGRKYRHQNVVVRWGDTGTEKTRSALYTDEEPDVMRLDTYKFDDWGKKNSTIPHQNWFDGYEGEERLVLDEFEGQVDEHVLLKWTEGHQTRLAVKGRFTYAEWTEVVITSNYHPRDWWGQGKISERLRRRIKKIEHWGALAKKPEVVPEESAEDMIAYAQTGVWSK